MKMTSPSQQRKHGNDRPMPKKAESKALPDPMSTRQTATTVLVNDCQLQSSPPYGKKGQYIVRGGLRGTEVFLSEDLSVYQRALFFKCREMRRAGKVKQTWTRDLSIYVKTNTDETIKIETETDLSTLENTTHRTIAPNPAPVTNPIMSTPFTTPRTSPAQSQTWSEDSSHSSFHGFDPMEYTPQPTTSAFSTSL